MIPISYKSGERLVGNLEAEILRQFIFKSKVEQAHRPIWVAVETTECDFFIGNGSTCDSSYLFLSVFLILGTLPRFKISERISFTLTKNIG